MNASRPMNSENHDRLLELMCDEALIGLSASERAELEALSREFPGLNDGSIERAAAAVDVALSGAKLEAMPERLKSRILAEGERVVAAFAAPSQRAAPTRTPPRAASAAPRRGDAMRIGGWLAAAAAIVIAAIGWLRPAVPGSAPNTVPTWANRPPSEVRADLLASAQDAVVIPMGDWDNPEQKGVTGDVVWSEAEQVGYLRLAGLKPNDPAVEQYQLWIVDSRGMGQRISGALFDAKPDPATGEVVVRIEPQIATQGAAAFALTIEKPGGVWVSDMTRRVVIGAKG